MLGSQLSSTDHRYVDILSPSSAVYGQSFFESVKRGMRIAAAALGTAIPWCDVFFWTPASRLQLRRRTQRILMVHGSLNSNTIPVFFASALVCK